MLKKFWWLRLEIIIGRNPFDDNAMRSSQRRIIELNLHIQNMTYTSARHRRHVVCRPNSTSDRDAAGHPRHVHSAIPAVPVQSRAAIARQVIQFQMTNGPPFILRYSARESRNATHGYLGCGVSLAASARAEVSA